MRADTDNGTESPVELVALAQILHGKSQIASSTRTLLHIPKPVVLMGPFWSHSCSGFGNNNGRLVVLVKLRRVFH